MLQIDDLYFKPFVPHIKKIICDVGGLGNETMFEYMDEYVCERESERDKIKWRARETPNHLSSDYRKILHEP